ncbi:hypothetical protein GGR28_003793 [Lewinella aquimaris]|uniref:HEAT repeat domain-containing protein n=1 Tax=Neolewinella aquimaris TaxID=1835722 RepID=A0A840ECA7_9BACT|nr:HEAT repeat domain-containing protein [Neolewinella aquimaris]MBB4081145.1 hypothetical protein [Neolewinella aquimaris]
MTPTDIAIQTWKKDICSENWTVALEASDNLAQTGGEEIIRYLIQLLKSSSPSTRNASGLALRELKAQKALNPLLEAIFKSANYNYNGTLVYALQGLDCSTKLLEIFKILFFHSFEAKMGAYTILEEQSFKMTREDSRQLNSMWKELTGAPEKYPEFENPETRSMIRRMYEKFSR